MLLQSAVSQPHDPILGLARCPLPYLPVVHPEVLLNPASLALNPRVHIRISTGAAAGPRRDGHGGPEATYPE